MCDIWGLPIYVKTHIPHTKSFNIPVSIGFTTLAQMLNGYDACLSDFQYARFQISGVYHQFGLLWLGVILTPKNLSQ